MPALAVGSLCSPLERGRIVYSVNVYGGSLTLTEQAAKGTVNSPAGHFTSFQRTSGLLLQSPAKESFAIKGGLQEGLRHHARHRHIDVEMTWIPLSRSFQPGGAVWCDEGWDGRAARWSPVGIGHLDCQSD